MRSLLADRYASLGRVAEKQRIREIVRNAKGHRAIRDAYASIGDVFDEKERDSLKQVLQDREKVIRGDHKLNVLLTKANAAGG